MCGTKQSPQCTTKVRNLVISGNFLIVYCFVREYKNVFLPKILRQSFKSLNIYLLSRQQCISSYIGGGRKVDELKVKTSDKFLNDYYTLICSTQLLNETKKSVHMSGRRDVSESLHMWFTACPEDLYAHSLLLTLKLA